MKAGDKYPVTIAGQVVAQAEIREVGNGTATLVVPGTVVVMATRTELTDAPQNTDTTGTETVIDSVERAPAPVESETTHEVQTVETGPAEAVGDESPESPAEATTEDAGTATEQQEA